MANAKVHINAQEGNRLETIKAHSGKTAKGSHSIQLVLPTPKSFLSALRFATRRPFDSLLCSSSRGQALRRKEKGISFRYPAFTSQRVRKTAPTLTRHAGLLSGRPYRGLVYRSANSFEILN